MAVCLVIAVLAPCNASGPVAWAADHTIALGQGLMAGEPTETSIILHARLTQGDQLVDGDLGGAEGVARFQVSTSPDFSGPRTSDWLRAEATTDYIVKTKIDGLRSGIQYYYRLEYGSQPEKTQTSRVATFRTLWGGGESHEVRIAIVTGMNYAAFHGLVSDQDKPEPGADKYVGYPSLQSILGCGADYFIGTGDNVYYDRPAGERTARTPQQLRRKWHEQFIQRRFHELFARVPAWWEKDDHDFRYDDSDLSGDRDPSVGLGAATFREQVPVTDPKDANALTYRTYRVNRDLQIWLTEGRNYRSPNASPDGLDKTIWGSAQREWLQRTLLASDATFKVLISPTPMIGPDRASKKDNHVNLQGFRHERDDFFAWVKQSGMLDRGFYIVCGDRHWQYHAIDPTGIEEFSCGALTDSNSIAGVFPGEKDSTDPEASIQQPYHPKQAMGGFLLMSTTTPQDNQRATLVFQFYDAGGKLQYAAKKLPPVVKEKADHGLTK